MFSAPSESYILKDFRLIRKYSKHSLNLTFGWEYKRESLENFLYFQNTVFEKKSRLIKVLCNSESCFKNIFEIRNIWFLL